MSVFSDVIPALAVTLGPVLLLAPFVYALRPQGGRRWLGVAPRPVQEVLERLADEKRRGVIPAGPFGDTTRPPQWTVPAPWQTADRDMTGAFPIVRAA